MRWSVFVKHLCAHLRFRVRSEDLCVCVRANNEKGCLGPESLAAISRRLDDTRKRKRATPADGGGRGGGSGADGGATGGD